ncbi:MAG TPA: DUF4388 domain-containing protein [Ktedonobacteraceae bacterium]|nr:DUF4388 domain-containing protein [Ktedonobacteraceae bacterium]
MSQQRETVTDRLVSIIQIIQLGRKTGLLTARRGEGITQEMGTITFLKGQITQTGVGRRRGAEALNWLTTWGNCRFTFVSSDTSDTSSLSPISSIAPESATKDTDPRLRSQQPFVHNQTGPLPPGESNRGEPQNPNTPLPTSAIAAAPFRTRQIDSALRAIENMGLSRTHRRLLLLIDGQRSIPELVRLMGRSEQEVASLLHDLEQATVIQIPHMPPPPFRG